MKTLGKAAFPLSPPKRSHEPLTRPQKRLQSATAAPNPGQNPAATTSKRNHLGDQVFTKASIQSFVQPSWPLWVRFFSVRVTNKSNHQGHEGFTKASIQPSCNLRALRGEACLSRALCVLRFCLSP